VLNKSKYVLDFRFFKVATLCIHESFAHSWHSLNKLHLECFSNSLEGVSHMLSTCWLLFLLSAVQLIPNYLNWFEEGCLWRPGLLRWADCGGHVIWCSTHHSPSWSYSPYTAWKCVGSLSYWIQMILNTNVPLSPNQMGWHIVAECCGSHAS
jgi:hypothetical protein